MPIPPGKHQAQKSSRQQSRNNALLSQRQIQDRSNYKTGQAAQDGSFGHIGNFPHALQHRLLARRKSQSKYRKRQQANLRAFAAVAERERTDLF